MGDVAPVRARPSSSVSSTGVEQAALLKRGEVLHRLLAALAPLGGAERPAAGRRLLAVAEAGEEGEGMLAEVLATLALPELSALFAPGSLAEVPLAGELADGTLVSGRIDRLAVTAERVIVADFKTDRQVPASIAAAPVAYRRQLGLYVALLARLYPGRHIEARLVYTAGPRVLELPEQGMPAAQGSLTSP